MGTENGQEGLLPRALLSRSTLAAHGPLRLTLAASRWEAGRRAEAAKTEVMFLHDELGPKVS